MDKTLEMRCNIEAVFEHYAQRFGHHRRANAAQRITIEDRKAWSRKRIKSRTS